MLSIYILQTKKCNNPFPFDFSELQLFRNKIGQIACDLYALESMIYHTAGIEDAYENPKIDVESAIVKAYSLEMLSRLLETIQQFPSLSFMIKGHPVEEHIRNVFQLTFSKESVDLLKLYIGVSGLQHCDVRSTVNFLFDSIISNVMVFYNLKTGHNRRTCEKSR